MFRVKTRSFAPAAEIVVWTDLALVPDTTDFTLASITRHKWMQHVSIRIFPVESDGLVEKSREDARDLCQ
jgi:hypothetical protein